jgi:HEPN domain-containing protein
VTGSRPFPDGGQGPQHPPAEWLEKAQGDIDVARRIAGLDRPSYDAIAFHCQQDIEKLIKAAMAARGVEPPKVHDLPELSRRARALGLDWSWPMTELRTLTMAAVHARYPGFKITPETAQELLSISERIWSSLRPLI